MKREIHTVPKSFRDKFPSLSDEKANTYWLKYLTVLSKYTMKQYVTLNHKIPINFPYKKAFDECGEFNYKKKRYYIWKEFGAGAGIIQLITRGSNLTQKNSEIIIKDTRHLQWALDTQDKDDIVGLYYGDCDDTTGYDIAVIDYASLTHYIRKTEDDRAKLSNTQALNEHLQQILTKAKTIKLISEYFYPYYNDYVLPQRISTSQHGRRYYKGINLQHCNKILRHACLGKCNEYDLATAVYGIKLMVAQHIADNDETITWNEQYPATKQYIEHKELIRETLAKYIVVYTNGKKLIKQVLNAIGFGATVTSPSWNGSAIAKIVMNVEERKELLKDEWLIDFIEEQKQLTNTITQYYLKDPDFVESIKDMDKMNKQQLMAHIFQTLEYQIMNAVCKHIPDDIIQLRVHDAVYTRSPIRPSDIQEIKFTLKEICPYVTLEHNKEASANGGDRHAKFKYTPDADRDIADHKESIRQEESLARQHTSQYTDNINVKQLRGQQEHDDQMLQTDTYLSMTESERKEYRSIMGVETNDEAIINKLINGENK